MNKRSIAAVLLWLAIMAAGLAACGGDGGIGVTGTWAGAFTITFDDSSRLSDNVILVLSQSGAAVTGEITNSGGTLPVSGEVMNGSLTIHFTVPCDAGANPKTATLIFDVSGPTMDITSGDGLACTKTISAMSGAVTRQ